MEAGWIVALAVGALLVRVGQVLGALGLARSKNAASGGLRSLADLCVATLCFWALGAAIHFQQGNPVLGIRLDYLAGWSPLSANWLAMLSLVLISTGTVAPAVAERSKLIVPLAAGALLAAVIVPLVGHWTWRGWLHSMQFIDSAGAGAIHLTGGAAAATAALFVGPREGKYNRDGSSNMIPGHSVPMIILSAVLMLAGWIPYVTALGPIRGTAAGAAALAANVMVAAAAAGAASLVVGWARFGKTDVLLTVSGLLGGLVSITAAAGAVATPGAFCIGLVAGVAVPWLMTMIDLRWKIDDPAGAIAIHGIGGVWALLAAAAFSPTNLANRIMFLGVQTMGIVAIGVTTIALTAGLMLLLRAFTVLRVKEADEYDGLDLAEHDINAHPDFQQTMIKSYHLREA